MTIQFLHFDSANSNYIFDSSNTSNNFSNPYKSQYSMNQTFTQIKKVNLVSMELPIGFSNIRAGSTNILQFILNNIQYQIIIPENNYTNIKTLLSDINNLCLNLIPNITITFSNNILNNISITFIGIVTTFSIIDTIFSKNVLGFRKNRDIFDIGSLTYTTKSKANLSFDNYILVYMPTFNSMNASMSNQISTFKLPLNSVQNEVYYYQENTSFKQSIDITDSNLKFNSLVVVIFDKFGNNINPNGLDFSFTISLEM